MAAQVQTAPVAGGGQEMTEAQAASLEALHSLWNALENSPLPKALTDPLPFEVPPHQHQPQGAGSEGDEEGPGPWYRGLEWLSHLHRERAIQRHLVRFSNQGDLLFPEEYIALILDREEREWREWEHQQQSRYQHHQYSSSTGGHAAAGGGVHHQSGSSHHQYSPQHGVNMVNYMGEDDEDDENDEDDVDDIDDDYGGHYNQAGQRRAYAAGPGASPSAASLASPHYSGASSGAGGGSSAKKTRLGHYDANLSTTNADFLMYDESGQPFDVAYAHDDYQPASSQYDPRSGFMTTPPASANVPSTSGSNLPAGAPSPSSSPSSLSAFQRYEGFERP